jgi:hypothetical protein
VVLNPQQHTARLTYGEEVPFELELIGRIY